MKKDQKEICQLNKGELQKFDYKLRMLLSMSNEEISKAVASDKKRIEKQKKSLSGIFEKLSTISNNEEKQVIQRLRAKYNDKIMSDPIFGTVRVSRKKHDPVKIPAIIHFTGNRDDLTAMGLSVETQAQDIFTIVGTQSQLANLATQYSTSRLQLPNRLFPEVDEAAQQAQIDKVQNGTADLPNGVKGKDVIVGIIDYQGLDIAHNGFRNPQAPHESRVIYYWVQDNIPATIPGLTPETYSSDFVNFKEGRLYDKDKITQILNNNPLNPYGNGNDQIVCMPSLTSHGTYVAGVAVGNGHYNDWNKTPVYIGAAPEADIIFVNCPDSFYENHVINGINFILKAAEKEQKKRISLGTLNEGEKIPVVINISLAFNYGPHNGKSLIDLTIDNLLNSEIKNCSMVCAGGNANDSKGHKKGSISNGDETITLTCNPPSGQNQTHLDIWYPASHDLDFWFGLKDKQETDKGWYTEGENFKRECIVYKGGDGTDKSGPFVEVCRDFWKKEWLSYVSEESLGDLRNIHFIIDYSGIEAHTQDIPSWTIKLRNPTPEIIDYYAFVGDTYKTGDLDGNLVNESTLTEPGCSRSVLTVGACQKKIPIKTEYNFEGEEIATYSGAGPTCEPLGRIKPEIVAVGGEEYLNEDEKVDYGRTTYVHTTVPLQSSSYTCDVSEKKGVAGTSFSSPLVAGAIALLLNQYNYVLKKNLTYEEIKQLLVRYAHNWKLNLVTNVNKDRNRYGFGRLRLLGAIIQDAQRPDIDVWIKRAFDDYGLPQYIGDVYWDSPDIKVCDDKNNEVSYLKWGITYNLEVIARNRGYDNANETDLRIYYTKPFVAPNKWHEAKDNNGMPLENSQKDPSSKIEGLSEAPQKFSWCPQKDDFEEGIAADQTHFCILVGNKQQK